MSVQDGAEQRASAPRVSQQGADAHDAATPASHATGQTTASLQHSVFNVLTVMAIAASALMVIVVVYIFQAMALSDAHEQLKRECEITSSMADTTDDFVATLKAIDFGNERVTLIDADGTVLYDNRVDASSLANHAGRTEVSKALETGEGSSERMSDTLGYVSIYEAKRLADGRVLRLSSDRAGVLALLGSSIATVLVVLAVVVLLSWRVSTRVARRLVQPILEIDPSRTDEKAPYRELEPLVSHLQMQQQQLVAQMNQIRDAAAIRTEFTANVTHELKTPIASIMGASELLRDGIVRQEDVQGFAARIYSEARRLSSLVSDILTLSKLDESERSHDMGVIGTPEVTDLYAIAHDVCDRMGDRARTNHVALSLDGEHVSVTGYPRLLDEVVGNLVENAIRYNVPGGYVSITVGAKVDERPYVRVADTGIGIPEGDQDKVFERFYRVDKSRSRASGGTGLGLAIVKHGAKIHGATIDLRSTEGKGTSVEVDFPAQGRLMPPAVYEDAGTEK